ncbi:hypothetical protein Tco_0735707 [Tanacetum coccineum]
MHTARGDGVVGIKRRRRDLSSDGVRNLATASGRGRLKRGSRIIYVATASGLQSDASIFSLCYLFRNPFSSTTIGDANPIRTLEDYSKPSHEGYKNTIELPIGNNVVPLLSDTIRLVQNGCSFHELQSEDPNQHLKDFLKLVDSLDLDGENKERTLLQDLAFYDNKSWNDPRDFAQLVKAISLPQDVPMNKIPSSCEICSDPYDTQYCIENHEQTFVEYASSHTDEAGGDTNPICTFEYYSKPSHEGYRNTIELPKGNNVVPLRSDTIRLVQNGCSFHGLRSEDPNQHLKDFLKLVELLDLDGENRERKHLSWNDPRDFAKPVKAISLPQDVPSTSDRHLIELENQVQRLMEAHLALTQPTQVNKITSLCEICSGPHDTQYCVENPEQAFVKYASSCTDEAEDKWYTFKLEQNNLGDTYNPSWKSHPNLRQDSRVVIILYGNRLGRLDHGLTEF